MPDKPTTTIEPGQFVLIEYGRWTIKTTWPRVHRSSIDATIHHLSDGDTYGTIQRRVRVNFLSDSKRDALARPLESSDREARKSLRDFLGIVAEVLAQTEVSPPASFPDTDGPLPPQDWILKPFWPATGATGLAAAPSSYKSFLALGTALQIATGKDILDLGHPPQTPRTVLYLDWEDTVDTFRRRLKALEVGAGMSHGKTVAYYRPLRPLSQSMEEIQDQLAIIRPDAIIVDSMSAAIDGSMNDSDEVNAFWTAIGFLGAPTMVITHKSIENQRRRRAAFQGSGMSLARVRMAWNAEKVDGTRIRWDCFKDNHGSTEGHKLAWEVAFHEDDGNLGGVELQAIDPNTVVPTDASDEDRERERQGTYDRIMAALEEAGTEGLHGAKLGEEIIGFTTNTAKTRMKEMFDAGLIERDKPSREFVYYHPDAWAEKTRDQNEADDAGLPDPFPV